MSIPTIAEIRDDILIRIQTALSLSAPPLPRSVFGVIATAVAGSLALVYRFASWTRRQIFTETMDGTSIDLRAAEYGLTRTPSTRWIGEFTATGNGTVTAGALIDVDGAIYRVTATVVVVATGTIDAESVETGVAVNLSTAVEGEFVSPIAGITRTVLVFSVTQEASDTESDAAFRLRLLNRQRNIPQGGAIPDWIQWTTEVPGIAEAKVFRPAAGFIEVYPILDVPDPGDRIPAAPKLAEVFEYISDPIRSPIRGVEISAIAPTNITFDVEISDLSPDTPELRTAIEDAIEAHLYSRRPLQYSDETDPISVVSAARITSIAVSVGADVASVVLLLSAVPIIEYELQIDELANLGTLTWI